MKQIITALAILPLLAISAHADPTTTGPRMLHVKSTAQPVAPISTSLNYPASRDYLADPEILHHDGKYYLVGTTHDSANFVGEKNVGTGIRCYSSTDLLNWKDEGLALNALSPEHSSYTRFLIWAPQMIHAEGAFWLFYNAVGVEFDEARRAGKNPGGSNFQRLIVARADKPEGPYTEYAAPLFTGDQIPGYVDGEKGVIGLIDAYVYADQQDGEPTRYYLYWSGINDEHNENLMWSAELRSDFKGLRLPPEGEEPHIVLGRPMQAWEEQACGERRILEAASILRRGDTYYMLYSANSFNTIPYGVGYATASHPLGPFTRAEHNPVLSATDLDEHDYPLGPERLVGPAGASFVEHPDGRPLITFAAIDSRTTVPLCSNDVGHARRPYLTEYMIDDEGHLTIAH